MANICLIVGKSGSGKSTSIKGLDPKNTVIVNVLQKKLPFKGSSSLYNKENHNLFSKSNYLELIDLIQAVSDKAADVKNIVIDDAIYIMRKEFFTRAKETGYGKFTDLAMHFQKVIATCESAREDLNVFFIMHSEDIVSDKVITGYKIATVGAMLENQYNPMEVVPMLLYADVKYDDKGNASFGFYTHRTMKGSIEIPAKTPADMFTEDFIPNDLGIVVKAIEEYYN